MIGGIPLWWCGSRWNGRKGRSRRRVSESFGGYAKQTGSSDCPAGRAGTLARWWSQAPRGRSSVGLSVWRVDELAHGVLGPPSVVPVGLGEGVEAPLEANDGDGEVREAGEIARQVAGSHPAAVFVVGDVAHVVESIFDAPMPAHQGQDDLRGGVVGGTEVRPCTVSCSTLPVLTMRRSRSMRKAT